MPLGVGSRPGDSPDPSSMEIIWYVLTCDSKYKSQRQFHLLTMKRHTGVTGLAYAGFRLPRESLQSIGRFKRLRSCCKPFTSPPSTRRATLSTKFRRRLCNSRSRRIITISRFSEAYHRPPVYFTPTDTEGGTFYNEAAMWLFSGSSPSRRAHNTVPLGRHSMTVSTAPPLAIELILDILEIVHDSELRRPTKRSSIVQCATVCKAWAPICQALLFQNVALPTLRSSIAFANAVRGSTGKAAWLRALVQSFEVTVCDEEDGRVITQ